jgi:hypothetical protein
MLAVSHIITMEAVGIGAAMDATSVVHDHVATFRVDTFQGRPDFMAYQDPLTSDCDSKCIIHLGIQCDSGVFFFLPNKSQKNKSEKKYEVLPPTRVYLVMKASFLLGALSLLTLLFLPSCVDPSYYAGSSSYGSSSYTTMPHGYNTVQVSGVPYYYYGNSWYRRSSGRYISCVRPHGYSGSIGYSSYSSQYGRGITRLPSGHRSVSVGSSNYYNHDSAWYRRSGSSYVTCARPSGYSGYPGSSYRSSNSRGNYGHNYNTPSSRHQSNSNYRSNGSSRNHSNRGAHTRSSRSSSSPRISPPRPPGLPRLPKTF